MLLHSPLVVCNIHLFHKCNTGPPIIREMKPQTAVTGKDFSIKCPVSGYPIDLPITWRKGPKIILNSKHSLRHINAQKILFFRREVTATYKTSVRFYGWSFNNKKCTKVRLRKLHVHSKVQRAH